MHSVSKPLQSPRISTPVGEDLHPQVQVHGAADEPLDFPARDAADLTNAPALLADQDPLLALAFDVQNGPNVHGRPLLAELLDLAREAVGHLLVELLERRLAHELAGEEAERLRADLVLGIEVRARGQVLVSL